MKDPTRLAQEDATIARLFAATRTDAPSTAQIDKAMARSRTTSIGASPSVTRRSHGPTWPATALFGVAIVASLGVWSTISSHRVSAVPAGTATEETRTLGEVPATKVEDVTVAIAVEALPSEAPAPPGPQARPRAPTVKAGSHPEPTAKREPRPSLSGSGAAAAAMGSASASLAVASTTPQSTFVEELSLVKSARAALARRDIDGCLRDVDRYDRTFAAGVFAEEIAVIRIEALARSGGHAQARTLAERFLSGHDSSPYASRVRSVLQAMQDRPVSE